MATDFAPQLKKAWHFICEHEANFFSGILYVAIFIPVFIYAYQEALDVWENLFVVLIVSFVAWLVAAIPCAFAFAFFRGILEIIADIVYAIWVKIKY